MTLLPLPPMFTICSHEHKRLCICGQIHYAFMMTSSNKNIFRVTGPLCGEFTGHRWIPLTKASDAELWFAPWINGWVNNREAGDLRRHRAHYDITLMLSGMLHIDITFAHALSQELWFLISIEQSGFIFALIVHNTYYICIIANGGFRCSNETFTLQ